MPASTYLWVWKSLFTGVPLLFSALGNSSSTVRMIDVKIPFLVQYYYSIHMRSLWSYNSYYWSQIESISNKVATKWYQVSHRVRFWLNVFLVLLIYVWRIIPAKVNSQHLIKYWIIIFKYSALSIYVLYINIKWFKKLFIRKVSGSNL